MQGENYASIHQRISLEAGVSYAFNVKVQTNGATYRMYIYDAASATMIAFKTFNNTSWKTQTLVFTPSFSCTRCTIGVDNGMKRPRNSRVRIDTLSIHKN